MVIPELGTIVGPYRKPITSLSELGGIDSFQFTVKTDNTGSSNNDQFTIPLYGGEAYDFTVAYDGQETAHNTDSDLTLSFPSGAGTYDVEITGTFAGIFFNGGGDRLKLTEVTNCGDVGWSRLDRAYQGCSNCLGFCGSIAYNAGITSLQNTWRDCSSAASFPVIANLVDVTNLFGTWRGCSSAALFPDVSSFVDVTNMQEAWFACNSCTAIPALPTASTALANVGYAFDSIGSGMGGTAAELWNTSNFPNITQFAKCFAAATGLTNYGDIPSAWK